MLNLFQCGNDTLNLHIIRIIEKMIAESYASSYQYAIYFRGYLQSKRWNERKQTVRDRMETALEFKRCNYYIGGTDSQFAFWEKTYIKGHAQ